MADSDCVVYLLILSVTHAPNQPVFRTLFFLITINTQPMLEDVAA